MKNHSVAFAVNDDRSKPVGADRMNVLSDATAKLLDLVDGVTQSAIDVQVKHDPFFGHVVGIGYQASTVSVLVFDYGKLKVVETLLLNVDRQHASVKRGRSIEVDNGDVKPDRAIVLLVKVTHNFPNLNIRRLYSTVDEPALSSNTTAR